MTLLVRLFLIPLGYFAALLSATSLIALIAWLRAYGPVADDPAALGMTSFIVLADWFILFLLIGQAAALPALAAVLAAEFFSLRHVLFFCVAGLFVAFAVSRVIDPGAVLMTTDPSVAAAAGLAGGLSYWLVAGRTSGFREPGRP